MAEGEKVLGCGVALFASLRLFRRFDDTKKDFRKQFGRKAGYVGLLIVIVGIDFGGWNFRDQERRRICCWADDSPHKIRKTHGGS